jgi:signal peptidase
MTLTTKVPSRVIAVLAWTVILGIGAAITAAVLVPRLARATPYTILTSSMQPGLPPGTLVVAKPVDPHAIAVGSVITYQRESGRAEVVTHRVVEVGQGPDGQPRWRTQGDANPVQDTDWVRPVQVKGRLWYAVPYLGRANLLLSGHQRRTATLVAAAGLLCFAGAMWAGALRDRVRRPGGRPVVA